MFVINNDVLAKAKETTIVMHPLPRNNEIDPEVDFDSRRAAYFRQMRYGLFVGVYFTILMIDTNGFVIACVGCVDRVDY
jgi:carbamoyl-phosphate synthase / aspartate carbamoyltransferase